MFYGTKLYEIWPDSFKFQTHNSKAMVKYKNWISQLPICNSDSATKNYTLGSSGQNYKTFWKTQCSEIDQTPLKFKKFQTHNSKAMVKYKNWISQLPICNSNSATKITSSAPKARIIKHFGRHNVLKLTKLLLNFRNFRLIIWKQWPKTKKSMSQLPIKKHWEVVVKTQTQPQKFHTMLLRPEF